MLISILQPTELQKALIPVRRLITRKGKTFMTTVYVGSTAAEKKKQGLATSVIPAPVVKRNVSRSVVSFVDKVEEIIDFAPDDKSMLRKVMAFQSEYFKGKAEPSLYEVVQMASEDVAHALKQSGDVGSNWYKASMDKCRATLAIKYPDLAGDVEWDFFIGILSVLSPASKVKLNLRAAVTVYATYLKTGEIPIKDPSTGVAYSIASTAMLEKFSEVLKSFPNKDEFVAFMNGLSTVGDLNSRGGNVNGLKDEAAYNSMIFGEKVGMFYQSMRGTDGAVAVDRWAIRSFYRWTGKLKPDKSGTSIDDRMSAHDRKNVEYVMQTVGEKLGLSPSETQAVLWYYEKRLYKKLGISSEYLVTDDYAQAAEELYLNKSMDISRVASMIKTKRFPSFSELLGAVMQIKIKESV